MTKAWTSVKEMFRAVFVPSPHQSAQGMSDAADQIEAASDRVVKSADRYHDELQKLVVKMQGRPKTKTRK